MGGREDTYDGDDVAMLILASITFLFPLHDCGCERGMVMIVKDQAGMCCGISRRKDLSERIRSRGWKGSVLI